MASIGYARVSTADQDLTIQRERLKAAGCTIIRSETASGASRAGRSELDTVMAFLRDGDELVVVRLDRLGRSVRDVLNLVHDLDQRGASLRVLDPEVATSGPMGRMVITILGMVADMELGFIKDRQRAGIEAAKGRGIYKGRPPKIDKDKIRALSLAGSGASQIAREMGISRISVYRALKDD
jgi:DNA invertase Pin-like site-specific DNA recombinase